MMRWRASSTCSIDLPSNAYASPHSGQWDLLDNGDVDDCWTNHCRICGEPLFPYEHGYKRQESRHSTLGTKGNQTQCCPP